MPKVHAGTTASSRSAGRGRRVATSLAEINVVPLVDVMLVLLVIFMITAPMIQRGVNVKLPVATRTDRITGQRVFISVPADYRQSHLVYLDNEPIRAEILQERVRQKMERANDKDVYLRGDGTVQLQELMEITDKLKAAGVQNVGIVTRLPGER
jgi:biopolymer transport protein ExbD/biopolymer transport protein TolR